MKKISIIQKVKEVFSILLREGSSAWEREDWSKVYLP